MVDLSDVLLVMGLVALGAGLAAFDWRLALIALGMLLFVVGAIGAYAGQRRR